MPQSIPEKGYSKLTEHGALVTTADIQELVGMVL